MKDLECKYCKHYVYDGDLTKVFWKLTQADDREVPVIGRCTFGNKSCGNAVLSGGYQSDGKQGCNAFEHRGTLKFRKYDTFVRSDGHNDNDACVCWIDQIQYDFAPRLYRLKTEGGGGWSCCEEDLSDTTRYQLLWQKPNEMEDS